MFYMFVCGSMVFLMQLGFAMLEAGCVSTKNIRNIMLKGVIDVLIAAVSYFLIGYSIAYGTNTNKDNQKFAGSDDYLLGEGIALPKGLGYHDWFFQFAFAATAATIVSGAVAERCTMVCYMVYSTVLTAIIYPVVVHWRWGGGWAADDNVHDFAGSGTVHMVGGLAGIVGAAVIGPRKTRFEGPILKPTVNPMPQHSLVFVTLGVMILWFGWYGFNTGSTLAIVGQEETAGLVIVNTTLCPSVCALTCLLLDMLFKKAKVIALEPALNGILAGLVAITAGCDAMTPGYAILTGALAAPIYLGTSKLQKMLYIDDVVDAGPVHFWCGIWGVLAVGLFADIDDSGILGTTEGAKDGIFLGEGKQFGRQLKFVIYITLWVLATSLAMFVPLKVLRLARVSAEVEESGLDISKHGAPEL